MIARSLDTGTSRRAAPHKSEEEYSRHEQEAVDRADGPAHRLSQERSREAPASFHGGHIGSARGGRGGPDPRLRENLRPGAEGKGGEETAAQIGRASCRGRGEY